MRHREWVFGGLMTALLVSPAFAATPKDTVVMAKQIDDIISLDPGEVFEFSGAEAVSNIYDKLIDFNIKKVSELHGRLVESWGVADDGVTYTFKMKKGLKFASGNPITAADAAWSLQRAVILNKTPGFILTQFGFTKDNVKDRIKASDPETLVIVTAKQVAPSFLYYCLTANVSSVVDSKLAEQHAKGDDFANEWLKSHSAGSNAFTLRDWRANEDYTLEANPNYWGKKPAVKRVVVRHVAEPSTQRLLLEKGDIDYARNLTRDDLNAIKSNPQIATQESPKGNIVYVGLNQKNPNLAKPEVREALKYLVDYDAIQRNILSGTYIVHESFLPDGFLGAIDDKPYKLDVAKAKALLAKAGLSGGFTMTMDAPGSSPYTDIAQAIQAGFAQGGVKLELIPGDQKQVITKYRARNHDSVLLYWGPDYQDPHTNAQTFASNPDNSDSSPSKTLAWRNSWNIPEMTKTTLDAVGERDAEKRAAIYESLQREHQKISPFIIMFEQIEVAAHRKNVDGFIMGPSVDTNFYEEIRKN
ncbi:MAG TPA: ABC transporter substrate-binding protein [Stellaceae bacterium]|nr:ABC transporter substrate-binding protein [Stellaceae bacterium]